ncbi:sensor histidine kinase [Aliinostoc sp. HNIBRCY26]|uniref:sensor histidine kinase n=1 Tax=Aliinostoc sp. HNIBRCY26 TaxID=3418997 RepID=UPI003CFC85AE
MNSLILADLFANLNILVLERVDISSFKILSSIPSWFRRFCDRNFTYGMNLSIPQEVFSFLENFLIDAEEFWQHQSDGKLSSGLWIQRNLTGEEEELEAHSLCMDSHNILLIELAKDKFQDKHHFLQTARENHLSYQQLIKENQKKEVLVHCIIHDIAGQLNAINCCLALLELENLTSKGKVYLDVATKQSIKQEMLIRDILDAFSADIQSLDNFITDDLEIAPDILLSVQETIELFASSFTLNNKMLKLDENIDITANWQVVGEQSRLDRIIANFIENAYRHSPPASTVTISLQAEQETILLTVDDEGDGVPAMMVGKLFQKFSQGQYKSGRAGIGLYFCRITIERWGGSIGYLPRPEGGSRFWFRLPKPTRR